MVHTGWLLVDGAVLRRFDRSMDASVLLRFDASKEGPSVCSRRGDGNENEADCIVRKTVLGGFKTANRSA